MMSRLMLRRTAIFASLLAAFALAACSSKASSPTPAAPTAPPAARTAAAATAAAPTPTLGPDAETAVALGAQVDLVDYRDPAGRYTVKLPRGWVREESPNLTITRLPQGAVTTMGIFCQPNATVAQLEALDQKYAESVGNRTVTGTSPIVVLGAGGAVADLVTSTTNLSGLALRNSSVYFVGKGCAWRIQLTTAAQQDFGPLLNEVLGTFVFT